MRIPFVWAIVIVSAGAQNIATPELGDVAVELRCPNGICRFHQGEAIRLELDFTAAKSGYSVQEAWDGNGLSPRARQWESFTASPGGCVGDPLEGSTLLMNGSGILGTPPLIPGKPFSVLVELNEWLRFGCPGKYTITARATRVYWTADRAAGFQHPRTIESKPLDIEIVPADADWQKEQLARILPELPSPGASYSASAQAAVRALGYLGSDDALREIRKRVPEAPMSQDFRRRNDHYLIEWEMARLELLRRAAKNPYR
jgi:hypothetical protein